MTIDLSLVIQPTISLEMPVSSQGHYGFHSFPGVDCFVCLYTYEFWLSLCKIVWSSVILLLPLLTRYVCIHCIYFYCIGKNQFSYHGSIYKTMRRIQYRGSI